MPLEEDLLGAFLKRRGHVTSCRSTGRKHQVLIGRQRQEHGESLGYNLYFGSRGKGKARQSDQLGLPSLITSSRLGVIGVVSSCPYLTLRDLGQETYWLGTRRVTQDSLVCIRKECLWACCYYLWKLASPARGSLSLGQSPNVKTL